VYSFEFMIVAGRLFSFRNFRNFGSLAAFEKASSSLARICGEGPSALPDRCRKRASMSYFRSRNVGTSGEVGEPGGPVTARSFHVACLNLFEVRACKSCYRHNVAAEQSWTADARPL